MKANKGVLVTLFSLFFLFSVNTAFGVPIAIYFDADGTGTTVTDQKIWGWDLESTAEESLGSQGTVDIVTHQHLATGTLANNDTFTEDFTVKVLNGLGSPLAYSSLTPSYDDLDPTLFTQVAANLYLDIHLAGFITGYNDGGTATTAANPNSILDDTYASIFVPALSSAKLYVDGGSFNKDYDIGETIVASYTLGAAGPIFLTPSVFSGAGAQVNFSFTAATLNSDFFSQAPGFPDPLVLANLFITVAQGGVALVGNPVGIIGPPAEILLGFQETGFDAKFNAVPEPATLLLFGLGLVGLARVSLKKFSNK